MSSSVGRMVIGHWYFPDERLNEHSFTRSSRQLRISARFPAGRSGVLLVVVLAVTGLARVSRRYRRNSTLALVRCYSVGAWICHGPAMCLGLRMDRSWNPGTSCTAAAPGGDRLLPARAQPDVCRLRGRMDWL